MPPLDQYGILRVDKALADWRQGDLALDEKWFTHVAEPTQALTSESSGAEGKVQAITTDAEGLVVLTQSCDIVRTCGDRHFLEVAPLVKVEPTVLNEVKRGRRPAYAFVPAIEGACLVADLDRTMTVEKTVAANWRRTQGCRTDGEARALAHALSRKRSRFAFPDDFTDLASPLQDRILEKHDRRTAEGDALRALREIRVRAAPSWGAPEIELFFWFILDEADSGANHHDIQLGLWLSLVPPAARFTSVDGVVVSLEDLTARDYVESDPLDLDHLSSRVKDGV